MEKLHRITHVFELTVPKMINEALAKGAVILSIFTDHNDKTHHVLLGVETPDPPAVAAAVPAPPADPTAPVQLTLPLETSTGSPFITNITPSGAQTTSPTSGYLYQVPNPPA